MWQLVSQQGGQTPIITKGDLFLRMAQLAKFLDPPIGPQELISLVAGHFTRDIRSAIVSRPNSLKETMKLLKDLQGNTGLNVCRTSENVEDRNARESSPRGGNQPFYRDGARPQMLNGRENNMNNESHRDVTGNGGGRTDKGITRWNNHDRFRDRRNNGMNRRVNFIGIEDGASSERMLYWMRNNQRRGYWNNRPINRRRNWRTVEEDDRGRRFEGRNEVDNNRRSPSPTMHQHPVERLLINQNARRVESGEDRSPRNASGSLNQ